ncbi:MAG: molybdate ABC transporter permease subunit [Oceanococcaceae bacterium]
MNGVLEALSSPALRLTLEVAALTTLALMLLAPPLAWWLATTRSRWRGLCEAIVALPLVLPPTVLGFYLLILMNPDGVLTRALGVVGFDGQLSFSRSGLVLASILYSLPFAVQPLVSTFAGVPRALLEAAQTLGASLPDRFISVVLPLSRRGFVTAATLTFAHTVGEFGVVLMVGGNIPGVTQMISVAIFDHVEALEYTQAHVLSLIMLGFSLGVLTLVYSLQRGISVAGDPRS